ncbi:MAG: carboxypeptidase regulatory-like domain-containing protein [Kofleriaceae bacterium]
MSQRAALRVEVSGRVVREDGRGIEGAIVAVGAADWFGRGAPVVAISDGTGAWSASEVPAGRCVVAAQAEGYLAAQMPIVAEGEARVGVEVALAPGGTLVSGEVRGVGGRGIGGARVAFERPWGDVVWIAIADADGRYRISLEDGEWRASVEHDEHASAQRVVALGGIPLEVDFALSPGAVVRGRVVDADGRPVPDAQVRASRREASVEVAADAHGAFELRRVPGGAVSISASGSGFASAEPVEVDVGVGARLDAVTVQVERAFSISGRVVAAGASAGIAGVALGVASRASESRTTTTAEDGSFRLVGARPARYQMFAYHGGYVPMFGAVVEVVDRDVDGVVVELAAGVTLSGRVEPAAVASLTLEVPEDAWRNTSGDELTMVSYVRAASDPAGAFALRRAPRGSFVLRAETSDGREGELAVEIADGDLRDLVVRIETRAAISGRVVDPRGAPVAGVRVEIGCTGEGGDVYPLRERSAATSVDGAFRARGLLGGKTYLSVHDDRGPLAWADPHGARVVELVDGVELGGLVLAVQLHVGTLRGVVVNEEGEPVSGARVSAREAFADAWAEFAAMALSSSSIDPVLSGADGTFEIDRLPSRTYVVSAEGDHGITYGEQTGVEIGAQVEIVLAARGTVAGRVRIGASPVERFEISCRRGSREIVRVFDRPDGTYRLERVDPGEYQCEVSSDHGVAEGTVVVTAGGVATLDFELAPWASLAGTVVEIRSGLPVEGVLARTLGDSSRSVTDERGRFALARIRSGSGELWLVSPGDRYDARALVRYEAPAGQCLDLGAIGIARRSPGVPGRLGVALGPGDLLVVEGVDPGGGAEAAGGAPGDRIIAIDGLRVGDLTAEVARRLISPGSIGAGQRVSFVLDRGGASVEVEVVAREREDT